MEEHSNSQSLSSQCEEIFANIMVNMFFLQFHCMTSGVVVPESGEH